MYLTYIIISITLQRILGIFHNLYAIWKRYLIKYVPLHTGITYRHGIDIYYCIWLLLIKNRHGIDIHCYLWLLLIENRHGIDIHYYLWHLLTENLEKFSLMEQMLLESFRTLRTQVAPVVTTWLPGPGEDQ